MLWVSIGDPQRGACNQYHNRCLHDKVRKVLLFKVVKKKKHLIWNNADILSVKLGVLHFI